MPVLKVGRRLFLPSVFFAFGTVCGILTARCASIEAVSAVAEAVRRYFGASVMGACTLTALAVPVLLLFLGMTLFGAFLILPCVLLTGGAVGWVLCALLRCGVSWEPELLLYLCFLVPQAACLIRVAAACMRLSAALRVLASGSGLRRPDVSCELRSMAVCFSVLLLSAVLTAMFLKRWAPF